jgi:hypothetical protein
MEYEPTKSSKIRTTRYIPSHLNHSTGSLLICEFLICADSEITGKYLILM